MKKLRGGYKHNVRTIPSRHFRPWSFEELDNETEFSLSMWCLGGSQLKIKENSRSIRLCGWDKISLVYGHLNVTITGLVWLHITLTDEALLHCGLLGPTPNLLNYNLWGVGPGHRCFLNMPWWFWYAEGLKHHFFFFFRVWGFCDLCV